MNTKRNHEDASSDFSFSRKQVNGENSETCVPFHFIYPPRGEVKRRKRKKNIFDVAKHSATSPQVRRGDVSGWRIRNKTAKSKTQASGLIASSMRLMGRIKKNNNKILFDSIFSKCISALHFAQIFFRSPSVDRPGWVARRRIYFLENCISLLPVKRDFLRPEKHQEEL